MYSAATRSLYSDVHRGVSSLAFGLWGKRWRPPNGTSEGGPTGGSLRPLVWFYFARWIILPGECRPLQQPTFLTHLDSPITQCCSLATVFWNMKNGCSDVIATILNCNLQTGFQSKVSSKNQPVLGASIPSWSTLTWPSCMLLVFRIVARVCRDPCHDAILMGH